MISYAKFDKNQPTFFIFFYIITLLFQYHVEADADQMSAVTMRQINVSVTLDTYTTTEDVLVSI